MHNMTIRPGRQSRHKGGRAATRAAEPEQAGRALPLRQAKSGKPPAAIFVRPFRAPPPSFGRRRYAALFREALTFAVASPFGGAGDFGLSFILVLCRLSAPFGLFYAVPKSRYNPAAAGGFPLFACLPSFLFFLLPRAGLTAFVPARVRPSFGRLLVVVRSSVLACARTAFVQSSARRRSFVGAASSAPSSLSYSALTPSLRSSCSLVRLPLSLPPLLLPLSVLRARHGRDQH